MKKLVCLLSIVMIFSCDKKDASDCFQTEGNLTQQEITVTPFNKILVNRDVELVLKQGENFKVVVQTGGNLLNDVEALVVDNRLEITDNNTCNYVRNYGITKVFVTAPNIVEIRSSTQYDISSDGVLNYDNMQLVCEDFNVLGEFTVGDFRLQVNSQKLRVVANNISSFYISGNTEDLFVGFYSGAGRFQGEDLIAQHVEVFHRGSNDMIVNPQQSLTGELRGTGNLISIYSPPILDIEQFYIGQLIIQD